MDGGTGITTFSDGVSSRDGRRRQQRREDADQQGQPLFADYPPLDLVRVSDVPKDIFTLRRTPLFLSGVKEALDELHKKAIREEYWARKALNCEVMALAYDFVEDYDKARDCRIARDQAIQEQRKVLASIRRRKRRKPAKAAAEQEQKVARKRETPKEVPAVTPKKSD